MNRTDSTTFRTSHRRLMWLVAAVLLVGTAVNLWQRRQIRGDLEGYVGRVWTALNLRNQSVGVFHVALGQRSQNPDTQNDAGKRAIEIQTALIHELETIQPATGKVRRLHSDLLNLEKGRLAMYKGVVSGHTEAAHRQRFPLAARTEFWHQELAILCEQYGATRMAYLDQLLRN